MKMFDIALFDDGLTLKTSKLAFIYFCIQTLHFVVVDVHVERSVAGYKDVPGPTYTTSHILHLTAKILSH